MIPLLCSKPFMTPHLMQSERPSPYNSVIFPTQSESIYLSDSITFCSPCIHLTPAVLVSLIYLKHAKNASASGSLHLLFPKHGNFNPRYLQGSFSYLLMSAQIHLLRGTFPDALYENVPSTHATNQTFCIFLPCFIFLRSN